MTSKSPASSPVQYKDLFSDANILMQNKHLNMPHHMELLREDMEDMSLDALKDFTVLCGFGGVR